MMAMTRNKVGPSDETLATQAAEGDAKALGRLYDRYAPEGFALALRVTGDERLAEEVVEEVFATLARIGAHISASGERVRTFVLSLVHTRAAELARAETRPARSRLLSEGQTDRVLAGESARAQKALAALPDEERELLLLSYFEGLPLSELEARTGLPAQTLRISLHNSLRRFAAALAQESGSKDALPAATRHVTPRPPAAVRPAVAQRRTER